MRVPRPVCSLHSSGDRAPSLCALGSLCCANPTRCSFSKGNKGQLAGQRAGAVLSCSPRKQSFFSSFENKQKIYIYIFIFSCRVAPEHVCMATICGFPQPHAADRGMSPAGWCSAGGLEGHGQSGQARAFPSREAPDRGSWHRPGSAAALGWEPAPEAQSLSGDLTAFPLGPETSG